MNKSLRFTTFFMSLLFLIIVVLIGGCVTGKQKMLDKGMKPMNSQNFNSLFSKTVKGTYHNFNSGRVSSLIFFSNGTMTVSNTKLDDEGTWRVVNGELCGSWKTIRNGAERCTTWFKTSDKEYDDYDPAGYKRGSFTVD